MKLILLYTIVGISSGLSLNKRNDSPTQELYDDFEQDFDYEQAFNNERVLGDSSTQQPQDQNFDNTNETFMPDASDNQINVANGVPDEPLNNETIKKSNFKPVKKYNKHIEKYSKPVEKYSKPVEKFSKPVKKLNNDSVKNSNEKPAEVSESKPVKEPTKQPKKTTEPKFTNDTTPKFTNNTTPELKNNTAPEFKNKTEEPKKLTQEQVWFPLPKGFDQSKPNEILKHVSAAYQKDVDKLPFTHFYVFGDSACDTNNLFDNNKGLDPNPKIYWQGRVSNGPIWPDYLEARFGLKRKNYAFIGSTISGSNHQFTDKIPDLSKQVDTYNATKFNTSNPLAIIQYIGNDLINHAISAKKVAADLKVQLQRLVDIGEIRHIMIIETSSLAYIKKDYNLEISKMVKEFKKENPKVEILAFAIIGHYANMLSTPPPTADLGKWHSTNAFCYNQTDSKPPCPDPKNFFLYDLYHPSTVPSYNIAIHMARKIKEFFTIQVPDFYVSSE